MPNIKIYIVTHHKDKAMGILTDPMYVPILAGAASYSPFTDNFQGVLPEIKDNTGDNISLLNRYYSELTALYWIWKNDDSGPDDIVGLEHYRRHFREPSLIDPGKDGPISRETILDWMGKCDFIVNGCSTYETESTPACTQGEETVYKNYKNTHIKGDMDLALCAIRDKFPDIYPSMEYQIMNTGMFCWNNVMITRKKFLDEYCEFLFTVTKYVREFLESSTRDMSNHQRAFGYLSERLFRPWLVATNHPAMSPGMMDWEKYSGYVWT